MAFQLDKTDKTPLVHINIDKGVFYLDGMILPEDALIFFKPILNYLNSYLESPKEETLIFLRLDYFNTAASRLLYNFLKILNDSHHKTKATVEWHFEFDDEDLEEVGEELAEMLEFLTFKLLPYQSESVPVFKDII